MTIRKASTIILIKLPQWTSLVNIHIHILSSLTIYIWISNLQNAVTVSKHTYIFNTVTVLTAVCTVLTLGVGSPLKVPVTPVLAISSHTSLTSDTPQWLKYLSPEIGTPERPHLITMLTHLTLRKLQLVREAHSIIVLTDWTSSMKNWSWGESTKFSWGWVRVWS